MRFWVLGFQGFATYPNFKVLGFQGLATIKILRSWVSRVLRHNTILRSWVSRVPRQKGRARSKIHQGLRPWTQRTQDLEPFWNLGTSLLPGALCSLLYSCFYSCFVILSRSHALFLPALIRLPLSPLLSRSSHSALVL